MDLLSDKRCVCDLVCICLFLCICQVPAEPRVTLLYLYGRRFIISHVHYICVCARARLRVRVFLCSPACSDGSQQFPVYLAS